MKSISFSFLSLCLLFFFSCAKEKAVLIPAPLTAEEIIKTAETGEAVMFEASDISESEKAKLLQKAEDVVYLQSETAYQAYLTQLDGKNAINHIAPIGVRGFNHLDWNRYDEVIEHSRLYHFLRSKNLVDNLTERFETGTLLTVEQVIASFPDASLRGIETFEFDPVQSLDDTPPQVVLRDGCGSVVCTTSNCGNCHWRFTVYGAHIIFIFFKHYSEHCANDCSCVSSRTWNGGC